MFRYYPYHPRLYILILLWAILAQSQALGNRPTFAAQSALKATQPKKALMTLAAPAIEEVSSLSGDIHTTVVSGTLLYAVTSDAFAIWDISNPVIPFQRSHIPIGSGIASAITVVGTSAYVGKSNTIQILDVENPDAPLLRSTRILPSGNSSAIVIENHFAYILSYTVNCDKNCGNSTISVFFSVMDISSRDNPTLVSTINVISNSPNSTISGNMFMQGTLIYAATGGTLDSIDISDPLHPFVRSSYRTLGYAQDVQVLDSLAYVADLNAGLTILDLTNPVSPILRGHYQIPRADGLSASVVGVRVQNTLAYLNTDNGLQIVDISDSARPRPRAIYAGSILELQVVGDLVYLVVEGGKLQILRVHSDRFPASIFLPLSRR